MKQDLCEVFKNLISLLGGEQNFSKLVTPIGCSEMLMAKVVTDLASRTPGKEAVAMESFAKALRMVRDDYWALYRRVTLWDL